MGDRALTTRPRPAPRHPAQYAPQLFGSLLSRRPAPRTKGEAAEGDAADGPANFLDIGPKRDPLVRAGGRLTGTSSRRTHASRTRLDGA